MAGAPRAPAGSIPNSAPSSTLTEFEPGDGGMAAGADSSAGGASAGAVRRLGSGSSGGGVSLEEPPQLEHSNNVSIQVEKRTPSAIMAALLAPGAELRLLSHGPSL